MSRKQHCRLESQTGFSLLEAVVVLGLIGVVLSASYPQLSTLAGGYRLDGAARVLALDLQKVHLRAIAEGKCFQVTFNASARTYQVLNKAGLSPCGTSGFVNDGAPRSIDSTGAVQVSASASPVFDTRGNGSTSSVITLTAPGGSVRLVAVNPVGRVNVQ